MNNTKIMKSFNSKLRRNRGIYCSFTLVALFIFTLQLVQPPYEMNRTEALIKNLGLEHTGNFQRCVASWYGDYFHGRTTANMEIFNKNMLTAAHKSLPFNTHLLVTNLKNNKQIIVRVNDRGPYIQGREIDLAEGAARALGGYRDGLLEIKYEILGMA